jgi:hypothetical protein
MVSEMVEFFLSQYLANFQTRGCGGDFSPQNLRATLRFRDICKKRFNSLRNAVLATRQVPKTTYFIDDGDIDSYIGTLLGCQCVLVTLIIATFWSPSFRRALYLLNFVNNQIGSNNR